MPIRTNRGRAAVYRRLWGWPMRSPTHLVVLLFVVAVLVIAVSVIVPQLTGTSRDGGTGAAAESTGPTTTEGAPTTTAGAPPGGQGDATTSLPTRIPSPPQRPSSAPPEPEALEVATRWGEAWVNHPEGTTDKEWLDGLRPFTTEEYMVELATVDPQNVPATRVTGPPEATESFTSSITVNLPTDEVVLAITLITTPQGWRVAYYEQVT